MYNYEYIAVLNRVMINICIDVMSLQNSVHFSLRSMGFKSVQISFLSSVHIGFQSSVHICYQSIVHIGFQICISINSSARQHPPQRCRRPHLLPIPLLWW